jgi:hypothetical protein
MYSQRVIINDWHEARECFTQSVDILREELIPAHLYDSVK